MKELSIAVYCIISLLLVLVASYSLFLVSKGQGGPGTVIIVFFLLFLASLSGRGAYHCYRM